MRRIPYISLLILLPLCSAAQGLTYDTSECARMNRQLSLRSMIQDETILRQQKQIELFTDALNYGPKNYPDLFYSVDEKRLRRNRNFFASTTGLLLIALAATLVVHNNNK